MVGPATNTKVELGLNMKGVKGTERLLELPAGQMCSHKVRLGDSAEVDAELVEWIKTAYAGAGQPPMTGVGRWPTAGMPSLSCKICRPAGTKRA
jgi:hypothetical protein